jgi:hypothetical protein
LLERGTALGAFCDLDADCDVGVSSASSATGNDALTSGHKPGLGSARSVCDIG